MACSTRAAKVSVLQPLFITRLPCLHNMVLTHCNKLGPNPNFLRASVMKVPMTLLIRVAIDLESTLVSTFINEIGLQFFINLLSLPFFFYQCNNSLPL